MMCCMGLVILGNDIVKKLSFVFVKDLQFRLKRRIIITNIVEKCNDEDNNRFVHRQRTGSLTGSPVG